MQRVVSLSGGTASAVAADRVIQRHGKENVILYFSDTLWEDEDLYRFLSDLERHWDTKIVRRTEGRTPLQVAHDQHIIPNSRIAPCSYRLKQRPFMEYIKTLPAPVTVYLGLDWQERHRMVAPTRIYESIPDVYVDYPLSWKPYAVDYHEIVRTWGIDPPRLYGMGFPHNNCGGRCVRQGQKEWLRLRQSFPERYEEVMQWEKAEREREHGQANHTILKISKDGVRHTMTLEEFAQLHFPDEPATEEADRFGCFCDY